MNIHEAQMNLNKAALEWYRHAFTESTMEEEALDMLQKRVKEFKLAAQTLGAEITLSEDSDFSRLLTLHYAEEQERIALRIANVLGERYGWSAEEKDTASIEVLGILTANTGE